MHPVAYYSQNIISAKRRYETYDAELLAIIEVFINWCQYLGSCQYKVLVLSDYKNLCSFIDTKSLSFRQVRWAKELSRYHFYIDYCQCRANRVEDILFRYPQRSQGKEKFLQAEITRILQHLQSLLINARPFSTLLTYVSSLKYVIICKTHAFPTYISPGKRFAKSKQWKALTKLELEEWDWG